MTGESGRRTTGEDDLARRLRAVRTNETGGLNWEDVRQRAEELPARRSWRPSQIRWGFAVAVALLLGSSFGFVLGTSHTPSGSAASGPVELGFLPAKGWNVLQAATAATPARPTQQAIAANVPLRPEDDADGVPYSTLLSLPQRGVVVVASFTPARDQRSNASFPSRKLPLRLRDAAPQIEANAQVRPTRPLGQFRLRANVNGYGVDVSLYFGTPRPRPALITAAQRQLDRLVVRSARAGERVEERALPMRAAGIPQGAVGAGATSRIIDRTFRCTPFALGDGLRGVEVFAAPLGSHEFQNPHASPGFLGVSSGGLSPTSDLVSVRAEAWQRFRSRRIPEGVYANARRCSAARDSVRLAATGLPGPPVQWAEEGSCPIRGRVLVRVRAVLRSPAAWQRVNGSYVGARQSVVEAALAIRSMSTRKPLAFMELGPAGKTRLWMSAACD
jgi:hypothetical protein